MPLPDRSKPGARPGLRPGAAPPPRPKRTEREAALDRIQEARAALARNSLWIKRGTVFGVPLLIGAGVLQGWTLVQLAAIPLALLLWWLDARLTHTDALWQSLYDAVFEGAKEPPLPGGEAAALNDLSAPALSPGRALISAPGVGLHLMMTGLAVVLNIIA